MSSKKGAQRKINNKKAAKPAVYPAYPSTTNCDCPDHPDLILLRDAAKDEREAIAFYLASALDLPEQSEVFLDATEDEMQHFVETMQQIARLDPVQADMLKEHDLDILTLSRARPQAKWNYTPPAIVTEEDDDIVVTPPARRDLPAINALTRALAGELEAANKYQQYMNSAEDDDVKELFCHLMNEEKEHIAEFTAALYELTQEPLPEEAHED